ncbi:Ubiquitin carboxyl-terminal hydrolase 38 [Podila horticola]|nr:Ubiquitin carboxyl-terminal hydrolase 38 [Podila horticola]
METIIRQALDQPNLTDAVKNSFIIKLLAGTASLSTPDANILLDFGLELRIKSNTMTEIQNGDRIISALSATHRQLVWARFHTAWVERIITSMQTNQDYPRNVAMIISIMKKKQVLAITEDEKAEIVQDMEALQKFTEKKCLNPDVKLDYSVQSLFIALFTSLPDTIPLSMSGYIESCWDKGPDNVFLTMPLLFFHLSDTNYECSLAIGHLLQAVPDEYTSVVDPFVQNLSSLELWRLKFVIQRLMSWLVVQGISGFGVWIVAIMESLASRGEFMMLRDIADENAYKASRALTFKRRRDDALAVLRFLLLGYTHSPKLFNNVVQGLIPLLMSCRKPEDLEFSIEVCNLAQILAIHFGDNGEIESKVSKARTFLRLPIVTRIDALQAIRDSSWKKSLQIQNTSAGAGARPKFMQPLGKVGLVNLGNSCFMNSALRALYCSSEFKNAVLSSVQKVDPSKVMTTRLRDTFVGLSTSRLSVFTPSPLYKALPAWLNDGHQQDAAEFTNRLEDEDPISKDALSSFRGVMINQVKCGTCGTVSTKKEDFYDLTVPLPKSEYTDLQSVVDVFPSEEVLSEESDNTYFCDKCQSLQAATRFSMLGALPHNLIVSLNRFEFDIKRSRRVKMNIPIYLSESIQVRVQESQDAQVYDLYGVVIHSGESANHGHYYTYAKEQDEPGSVGAWLLYNDTSISQSFFGGMQQALKSSRDDTPKNQNQARSDLFGGSSSSSHGSNTFNRDREQQTALLYEQQNDFRMEELASKVSALNKITVDIHNEVHGQHALLDQNSNSFNDFGASFATTIKKLNVMASQQLGKSMCWMVGAIVFVFFIVYFILSKTNSPE